MSEAYQICKECLAKHGHCQDKCPEVPLGTLLEFPSDVKDREKYFAPVDKGHPARANLWMMRWLIRRYSEPGQTILDPTSGAGSIMIACLDEYDTGSWRNAIGVEIEKHMADVQTTSWAFMKNKYGDKVKGNYQIIHGDTRRVLPIACDVILYSPPYSNVLGRPGPKLAALAMESGAAVWDYGNVEGQIGKLAYFPYLEAMRDVYKLLLMCLKPGGIMCTITKDNVDSKKGGAFGHGGVIPLSADTVKVCYQAGFELHEMWQRYAKPSMQLSVAWKQAEDRGQPIPHVVTEEMIVMRRPK